MANLVWNDVHFWDLVLASGLFGFRVWKYAPRLIARVLPPLLKFIANKTGSFLINDYLNENYPSKKQRRARQEPSG